MLRLIALLTALFAGAACAGLGSTCYTGYARHRDSGALAYTARYQPVPGDKQQWRVVYRNPAGAVIGRKRLDFTHHPFVPVYALHLLQFDEMAGIRRKGEGRWRMVERKRADAELTVEPFELRQNMAADVGMHPFVQAHFKVLMTHEPMAFQLVVPARQSVLDMTIRRISDVRIDGERAVRFRASLDLLFVNWFTQELTFAYDPDSRKLLRYTGISNMQDAEGDTYPVRVRYRRNHPPPSATPCAASASARN